MWRIDRPTQSVKYVPIQVNRFAESVFLIVQYRYLKSCSGDFDSPESDPPHKIMRNWFYDSIWLGFSFPSDRICQEEIVCIGGVPVSKRYFGGAGPSIFYMMAGSNQPLFLVSSVRHWTHLESILPSRMGRKLGYLNKYKIFECLLTGTLN